MDKNRIKKFAIWARTELITRVTQRAYFYGVDGESKANPEAGEINGRLLTEDERRKRRKLVQRVQEKGFQPVMEEAAYTWFNRFAALRYMEVNGVLPTRVRVFSSREGAFAPQILDECLTMENLDGLDKSVLFDLKEKDATEELYKYLLITQCNALGSILPVMFQQIEDYTELLLPDNLLREGSVIHQLVTEIDEEDWRDAVQIIGWLYQYYNSEPKDAVFAALKKNIKVSKENIPAATQLFTPDWIVRYMVENSLGRLYIESKIGKGKRFDGTIVADGTYTFGDWTAQEVRQYEKDTANRMEWKYYLPEAMQEPEVEKELFAMRSARADLRPEDIKVIDPCMGSGHILVYAFDVLVQIYKDAGFREKDIPELILKNNLFGLDIDDRAYQLAYFAVMMRAWHYNKRILVKRIEPNLCAIQESNGLSKWSELTLDMNGEQQLNLESQFVQLADELIEKFRDAKEYGSILDVEDKDYEALLTYVKDMQENSVLDLSMAAWLGEVAERLPQLVKQAKIMGQKYDVVVTNPPYMGSGNMGPKLSEYVKNNYPDTKSDMSTVSMEKTIAMLNDNGYMAMINIPVWMFLTSYETLRQAIIDNNCYISMVHLGRGIFGSDFGTTAFVIGKRRVNNYKGVYRRLFENQSAVDSIEEKENKFLEGQGKFVIQQENYSKIPGSPLAYWISEAMLKVYSNSKVESIAFSNGQILTGNNEKYLRLLWEVESNGIKNRTKYALHAKGGEQRRWYGNIDTVVAWDEKSINHYKKDKISRFPKEDILFRKGITWSLVSSSDLFSMRLLTSDTTFNKAAATILFNDENLIPYVLGLLNTTVVRAILKLTNPTLNTNIKDILAIPVIIDNEKRPFIESLVSENISLSKNDWNNAETSWDFYEHPLIKKSHSIDEAYQLYKNNVNAEFETLKANEEELNRIFIDIYGLAEELTPEVAEKDVTVARIYDTKDDIPDTMKGNSYVLTKADVVKSLLSYAVGCMFGRYSLDEPGLIMAGGELDHSKYQTFQPDEDAIIPICDDEYFEDDMVQRFCIWLKAAFGEEHYRENLQFIADALEGKGTPLETIRSYFLNDFYTDHCKRYQKRPIYWLFDAGKKNSFKALVYIHRYDKDTIARMRTGYVYKQQELYKTRIETTQNRIDTAASQADKNKFKRDLKKLREQYDEIHLYEEKIHHYADLRQEIDLDDGVKHNYALFEDVLAKIK